MEVLFVDQYGSFIRKKSERIRVTSKKGTLAEVPLINLEQIVVTGKGISISCSAIRECVERGIPIHMLAFNGKPYARLISPHLVGTVRTRREQLLAYNDQRGVILAKAFAGGKLANQATLLKYTAKYRKARDRHLYLETWDAAREIESLGDELRALQAETVDELRASLMNREGRAADIYWKAMRNLLLVEVEWQKRERRGATDPVNSSLNYGYGILYSQVENSIILAGLDPYAGFIHVDRPGKPSLVLDLIEEFRQMIVDRTIFGLLNKGTDLAVDEDGRLTQKTRRTLAEKVLARLEGRETYREKKHTLRTILQSQARLVAAFVRGEGNYTPYVGRW